MPQEDDDLAKNMNMYSKEVQEAAEIGKKSVKRKQKERQLRKQKKKQKRVKTLLRFLFFVLVVLSIYAFIKLPQWYLREDAFSNPDSKTIEFVNNKLAPLPVLYNSLGGIKFSKMPIFIMPVSPVKKELYKLPVIKDVYVRRYGFPARIKIIVREKVPSAVLKTDLKQLPVAFVTTDGTLVTTVCYMASAEYNNPLKILVKHPDFQNDWDAKRVQYIEKIAKEVEKYSSEKVDYVDMTTPNDVYVKIESTTVRLGVLDSTVFERIERLYTILPQINKSDVDGSKIKYVDISWDRVQYLKLKDKKKEEEQLKAQKEKELKDKKEQTEKVPDKKKNDLQR